MFKEVVYVSRGMIAAALVVSLAGCGRTPPKASNAQLETLLGDGSATALVHLTGSRYGKEIFPQWF